MKELTDMYNKLQEQYDQAQDAAVSAANLLSERDGIIEEYSRLIGILKNDQLAQSKLSGEEAATLRDRLTNERLHFIETLNRLSQAKTPAEEAFREMEELLERKAQEYLTLQEKFNGLAAQFEDGNTKTAQLTLDLQRLLREKADLEHENQELRRQFIEAKRGRKELQEIENLKRIISEQSVRVRKLKQSNKKLHEGLIQAQQHNQQDQHHEEEEKDIIRLLQDKILDLQRRIRDLTAKNDEFRGKVEEALQETKLAHSKEETAIIKANDLERQNVLLLEQNKKMNDQRCEVAGNRVKAIQGSEVWKAKIQTYKKRTELEIQKRLTAEELIVSQKEEIFVLQKENAVLKDQCAQSKSPDLEPLVALLKDLRLEAIEMEDEYRQAIELIKPARPIMTEEIPKAICESMAVLIGSVLAQASSIEVENRELRLLLRRFARAATNYHRIVEVIQLYPILSTDDIGMDEPYGNWVLGVDVEHLQRTIVKLHEILSKRR
jgi:hypothetical protein